MNEVNSCPNCLEPGHWRSGVHFDHQKRCPKCNIVWCPGDEEDWCKQRDCYNFKESTTIETRLEQRDL